MCEIITKPNLEVILESFQIKNLITIEDFDHTHTLYPQNEKSNTSSSQIEETNILGEKFNSEVNQIRKEYIQYLNNPNNNLKSIKMSEWTKKVMELKIKYGIQASDFSKTISLSSIELRPYRHKYMKLMKKLNVPQIFCSGGSGNYIETLNSQYNTNNRITTLANFIVFNGEKAIRIKEPIIEATDKAKHISPIFKNYERNQIILIGNSTDDAKMTELITYRGVIKIGFIDKKRILKQRKNKDFFYQKVERFKEKFDIVIIDGNFDNIINYIKQIKY